MMEQEFKWKATEALLTQVRTWALARPQACARTLEMGAQYFDTEDQALAAQGIGLRLRRENERTVCCLKRREQGAGDGLRIHEEYECEADTLAQGLQALPRAGAPRALCLQLSELPLGVLCEMQFTRHAIRLQEEDIVCELALDQGQMRRASSAMPICEIELELHEGELSDLCRVAQHLQAQFALVPEPLSKLARARQLAPGIVTIDKEDKA